jgi:hypothetical protein
VVCNENGPRKTAGRFHADRRRIVVAVVIRNNDDVLDQAKFWFTKSQLTMFHQLSTNFGRALR